MTAQGRRVVRERMDSPQSSSHHSHHYFTLMAAPSIAIGGLGFVGWQAGVIMLIAFSALLVCATPVLNQVAFFLSVGVFIACFVSTKVSSWLASGPHMAAHSQPAAACLPRGVVADGCVSPQTTVSLRAGRGSRCDGNDSVPCEFLAPHGTACTHGWAITRRRWQPWHWSQEWWEQSRSRAPAVVVHRVP